MTHVDAAKGMVQWAGENRKLSGVDETKTRWIVDDAQKNSWSGRRAAAASTRAS